MIPIPLGKIVVATPGTLISIDADIPAVIGSNVGPGPFVIASTNDKLVVVVDAGAPVTVTLHHGTKSMSDIAGDINGQLATATASANAGLIYLVSNTNTVSSSISLTSVSNSAYATIGLSSTRFASAPDQRCMQIMIRPLPGNAGSVYVGTAGFSKSSGFGLIDVLIKDSTGYVDRLWIGNSDADIVHTKSYWIDADTANDGVLVTGWVT